jgi:hypothetical protein
VTPPASEPPRSRRPGSIDDGGRPTHPARVRGGWRPWALVGAGLVAALMVTGRLLERDVPRARPERPGGVAAVAPARVGGRTECPASSPVLAAADHRSYPAGHPARPAAATTAVGCYRSAAEAGDAGYAPAPLPAGALEVGGVYLAPVSPGFRASCRRAAGRLGFAVPCPGLLPTSPAGTTPASLCQPASCARPSPMPPLRVLSFSQDAFAVRPGATGAPGEYGALSIAAVPVRDSAGGRAFGCDGQRRVASPTVAGRPAQLLACPAGAQGWSSDSVVLRWSAGGTFVATGLRGDDAGTRRLVVALAGHVRMVGP